MCLGSIAVLEAAWEEDGVRLGRLGDGCVVPLTFVPEAAQGDYLLLHLGMPVEILAPEAASEALSVRSEGGLRGPQGAR